MKFLFDLDDTLVSGDTIAAVSTKMMKDGVIDQIYTNADIKHYDLRDLPENVSARVKEGFADPKYVWVKHPIVGTYYFLNYLENSGHELGMVTARPMETVVETVRFMKARFPDIDFALGHHFVNSESQLNMKDLPSKERVLEEIEPTFYFDDNVDYCKQANNLGIKTYLISNKFTPWNREYAEELKKETGGIQVLRNVGFFPEVLLFRR